MKDIDWNNWEFDESTEDELNNNNNEWVLNWIDYKLIEKWNYKEWDNFEIWKYGTWEIKS